MILEYRSRAIGYDFIKLTDNINGVSIAVQKSGSGKATDIGVSDSDIAFAWLDGLER